MATWITHLRIAETLLTCLPGLEAGPFAAGNIAPDSGIPDANCKKKLTPDPQITHFSGRSPSTDCADIEFYNRYLLPLRGQPTDPAVLSFRLGYFFHLATDNLWRVLIKRPTRAKCAAQIDGDSRLTWEETKRDWYGQDFVYVQNHPDCLYWKVFLAVEPDTAGLDFLPQNALSQRVAYIKTFYQRRDAETQQMATRPMAYFSIQEMDQFVDTASRKLRAVFDRLWVKGLEIGDPYSALDWALKN